MWKFRKVFEEPPEDQALPEHKPWDHEIPLKDGESPQKLPIYSMSPGELKELKDYVDSNLRRGYIRASTSEAGYPVIFVPKKDKDGQWTKRRMCVDYRKLNAITKKNRYPLPLIEELQDRLNGAKWFTKLDIREGYYKVRIKKGEEWKTAFRTRYGLYEYQVMPFGLTNAPATFQGLINHVLYDHLDDFVIAYLDDILIFSKTKEEHTQHVQKVLERLTKENLRLKPEKCEFYKQEVEYLGHIVTPEGLQMNPDKIKAILEYPAPTNVREILSFQGLAGYYRRFITGFSEITAPITDLLKGDTPFIWQQEQEQAFRNIKEEFRKEPILVHFDFEKQGIIDADASKRAIGARLQQKDDQGRKRLVACYARKLTKAEQNYDVHDRELLAIVEALQRWRSYLAGAAQQTIVKSDHKNLQYFMTTKKLNGRQARWAEVLAEYDFTIQHCKGKDNSWADALSRRPDYMQGEETQQQALLRTDEKGEIQYNREEMARLTRVEAEEPDIIENIRKETAQDKFTQQIKQRLEDEKYEDPNMRYQDGLLLYEELIYVPRRIRQQVIQQGHDQPTAGHFGVERTLEKITREYYFPGMRQAVEKHIKQCDKCRKSKASRHQPYGKLQPLDIPKQAWESIAMDFIVKLPKSKEPGTGTTYDAIYVVADRLTKRGYFIPWNEEMGAEDTAYLFERHIAANHGTPAEIVSDRDTRFRSTFWRTLMALRGTKQKLSTAAHAQTDGQTERLNQILEQYLRCFVNYRQDDWVKWLPLAQFAYNDSVHSATGFTPFFADYGREVKATRSKRESAYKNERAQLTSAEMEQLYSQLQINLKFFQERMRKYYDRRHEDAPQIREGQKVYLLRKNLKSKRPCEKLDFKKLGAFRVLEQTGPVNFKLQLPKGTNVYPVFHISMLEPAPETAPMANIMDAEGYEDQDYTVERILAKDKIDGRDHWLVKWKNYPSEENTWEPIEHLQNAQEALKDFQQQWIPRRKSRKLRG